MKTTQIIINSVKILIASILAILIAQILKLDFAISAGIVAILSVQLTKKETIKTALSRFYAFIAAILISFLCFKLIGFTSIAFFVYLLVFIPLCYFCRWNAAMAMDSVLISHFLNFGKMGLNEIKNEVLLFIIGVGFGIIANLFLHKKSDYIEQLKTQADEQIKYILHRMSQRILNPDLEEYNGSCFTKLENAIFEAEVVAKENYNNQFRKNDIFDQKYIEMRKKQKDVLLEIYKCIIEIKIVPHTAQLVSDFLERISVEYEKNNDVHSLLEELDSIQSKMKEMPMPQKRDEFEARALLFIILRRLNEFLNLKKNFSDFYLVK